MGTKTVSSLIPNYRRILLDPTPGVTWADADFLRLVNQAELAICLLKPEAFVVRGPITLVVGTHQSIPAQGTAILDIYENIDSQRRPSQVERELLDASNRYWPAATQEKDVQHWTADPRDPTHWECFPSNDATGAVTGLYGLTPVPIAAVANTINLPDTFEMAIQAFVLGQAYAENTTRQDLAKAAKYEGEWKQLIGFRTQGIVSASQKSTAPGGA